MKLTRRLTKWMSLGILATIVCTPFNSYGNTPELLHSSQKVQTITKGATYITDSRLTTQGWQDLNILKINLDDPNIKVRPIQSNNIGERQTVLSLVQAAGAVAGVNADFFDMSKQNAPGFGAVIDDGEMKHGYNDRLVGLGASKDMGTMLIDNNKNIMLDYFSVNLTIQDAWSGNVLTSIVAINKPTSSLTTPVYLDRNYGPTTIPLETGSQKLYKIVVEDNIVTKIIQPGTAANIPQNGYVIAMNETGASTKLSSFSEGQELIFTSQLTLGPQFVSEIQNIEAAVGGGGLIMKDGKAYTGASHKVSPTSRHPRTVIGASKDGKTLFLITIDGRGESIGATHNELVPILQSYGVYTAMYLDGGGSTTFVSRDEGDTAVKVQNNPSEGTQRKVTNGIGVFTTSSRGNVAKLLISSTYDRTFINNPITFTLQAVDENNNPVSIEQSDIKWSVEGVQGNWGKNSFYPTTAGKGLVIAQVKGVEVAKQITVSQAPVGIEITPAISVLNAGSDTTMKIMGVDAEGYESPILPDQLQWKVSSDVASVSGTKITGVKEGQAIITASLKNQPTVQTKISTVVGKRTVPIESLEDAKTVTWGGSNSKAVTGQTQLCKDLKYHGEASAKFIYTLAKTTDKQVAYMKFASPVTIDAGVQSVGMWVYGREQGDMLKVELTDAKGKVFALQAGELNFKGWKYISIPLTEDIGLPAKLNRMYVIANNNAVARTSAIYIDHISVTYGTRDRNASYLKAHEKFDPLYKDLNKPPSKGEYDFTLIGTTQMKHYPFDDRIKTRIKNSLQQNAKFTIFSGRTDATLQSLKIPNTTWKNEFNTYTYENTQVIHIGTNAGGIVKTNPAQWKAFQQVLEQSTSNHIIIVMNQDPLSTSGFTDRREGQLFHDVLEEYKRNNNKNIMVVVADGYDTDVQIKDGIRYIYTNGMMRRDDNISKANIIRFRVNGNSITYMIESALK